MNRYVQASGAFFGLLALVQLARTILQWPVQVATVTVPVWVSGIAFLITGAFALWALRSAKDVV